MRRRTGADMAEIWLEERSERIRSGIEERRADAEYQCRFFGHQGDAISLRDPHYFSI